MTRNPLDHSKAGLRCATAAIAPPEIRSATLRNDTTVTDRLREEWPSLFQLQSEKRHPSNGECAPFRVRTLLPAPVIRGRPRHWPMLSLLDGILYVIRTGGA